MGITLRKCVPYLSGVMIGGDQSIPQAECILVRTRGERPVDQMILAAQEGECNPDWQVYLIRILFFLAS